MEYNYDKRLYKDYRKSHTLQSGTTDGGRVAFFEKMYEKDYRYIFEEIKKDARILEIGCNVGTMLGVLYRRGYQNLTGIDLSPDDLAVARRELPGDVKLEYADAFDFLDSVEKKYDAIFSRAVFEHIKKDQIILLLERCKAALNPRGILVIDVPNMDWLLASHERYMDFTHECGYNSDSLGQIMRNVFGNCDLFFAGEKQYSKGLREKFARYILGKLYKWSLETPSEKALFSRDVIGVAKRMNDKQI